MLAIAVIDHQQNGLFIYDVPKDFNFENIDDFLIEQGHKPSVSTWGQFDGQIVDLRE